ncbi:universal stress protein [Psychrobacillus psychrotolerans]|uniref:universal stress protein n=1 Tax=Psychrobacillus psychrotolerans TaxID=126156 RepID=UPI003315B00A
MYPHILLATDGSENSVRAAKEAIKLAMCSANSKVEVVMVTDFDKSKQDILHAQSAESLLLERKRKISNVEQLLKDEQVNYKITFLKGSPGPEIVRYAKEQKVDLVVLGSRGLNTLQEMVLGSVSHKVMKRVHCPALIVK